MDLPNQINSAMNGFVITLSGMNEVTKKYCRAVVEDMGGNYSQDLHSGVTHLVTSTVLSRKYQVAVSRGIPVKTINWFKSARNSLDDSCPIMLGVSASMTQMSKDQKISLSNLIEKNGGQCTGTLNMGITNVLICGRGEGAKYSHAVKWTVPCVKPQWLEDSASQGLCLSFDGYFVGDRFLKGMKLAMDGLGEDARQNFNVWVSDAGGEVVGEEFSGEVDYLIMAVGGAQAKMEYKQCVSFLWLEDCLNEGRLLKVEYYHRVINVDRGLKPLKGVVVSLSGYAMSEREYLKVLVEMLGGVTQEVFARRDNPVEGIKSVTHLVCKEGQGEKFEAALKWDVLVVRHAWILMCLKELNWVSEDEYKVIQINVEKNTSCHFKRKFDKLVPENNNKNKEVRVLNNNVVKTNDTVDINSCVQEQINRDIAKMDELMKSFSNAPCVKRPGRVMKTRLSSVDLDVRLLTADNTEENCDEEEVFKNSQIIWVDPREAVERDKLLTQLNDDHDHINRN